MLEPKLWRTIIFNDSENCNDNDIHDASHVNDGDTDANEHDEAEDDKKHTDMDDVAEKIKTKLAVMLVMNTMKKAMMIGLFFQFQIWCLSIKLVTSE